MDIATATIDDIEQQLLDDEAQIARLRASQIVIHGPPWLGHARAKGMVISEQPISPIAV